MPITACPTSTRRSSPPATPISRQIRKRRRPSSRQHAGAIPSPSTIPQEAGDLLIAANKDALTDPALIQASLKALVDGHFLRSEAGVIGTIDPAKVEAIGNYLFNAGILLDGDGKVLKERPDFGAYFSNEFAV